MPPTKRSSRGRQRQSSQVPRQLRSRSVAQRDSSPTSQAPPHASMGPPPAECNISQHFDDEPALQQVVSDATGSVRGGSGAMEMRMRQVERRLDASDRLLQEMHAMVSGMHQDRLPAVTLPAPPNLLVLPPTVGDTLPPMAGVNVCSQPQGTGGIPAVGPSAPWPSPAVLTGNCNSLHSLPRAAQDLVAAASGLTRHSWVPDNIKGKIWSGEYVNMASLLHDSSPQSYNVSVRPGEDSESPMFCLAPRQKNVVLSFEQWLKAFEIYQSVLLLQPSNLPDANALLMYIETIRNMYERGSDWRSYDEAFRSLRQANNWAWDSVCMRLWMDASMVAPVAAPSGRQVAAANGTPFHSKGKASWGTTRWPSNRCCFAFNRGEVCNADTCRYMHKCKRCGGAHAYVRCNRPRPNNPASTSAPAAKSSPAGPRPTWYRK